MKTRFFVIIEIAHQAEVMPTGQNIDLETPSPSIHILQNGNEKLAKGKYRKSFLASEQVSKISRKLIQLMEMEKPFLKPDLTLSELANRLSVSANDLSQVINRAVHKNYFDFVNEYRVREAKRMLSSAEHGHLSIVGIALDAGFNSKSTFYNAFSKHIGTTPSGFRRQCELSEQGIASNIQGHV